MGLSPRRLRKAQERAAKGYPSVMGKDAAVENREWMSQFDAANALDVGVFRIGALIGNRHLVPAENESGEAGVTRTSVEREQAWRSSASFLRRVIRMVRDAVNYL